MESTIYHWDFFGPEAAKTAEHFKKHLAEFNQKQGFEATAQGFFSVHNNHTCFWIEMNDPHAVQDTKNKLRPQRSLSRSEHEDILLKLEAQES